MKKGTKAKRGYVIERKTYSVKGKGKTKSKIETEYTGYEVNWLPSGTEVRFYEDGRTTLHYHFPFEVELPEPIAAQARAAANKSAYFNDPDYEYTRVAAKRIRKQVKKVEGRKTY